MSETQTKQITTGNHLVRALLFGPMQEPYTIPTIERSLYSAFMNGLRVYLNYEADTITYFERNDALPFEITLWNQFQKALRTETARLRQNPLKMIERWMKPQPHLRDPSPFFYALVRRMLKGRLSQPTYTPTKNVVEGQQAYLKLGNPHDLEQLVSIARNARPFIEEDVDYIQKNYKWN